MPGSFSRTMFLTPNLPKRAERSAPVGPQPMITTSVVSILSLEGIETEYLDEEKNSETLEMLDQDIRSRNNLLKELS